MDIANNSVNGNIKQSATASLNNQKNNVSGLPAGKAGLPADKAGTKAVTKSIFSMIESQKEGFKLALPKDFDSDRFTRIAITALKNNDALQRCEPMSILGCLMLSAQLGLEPNSPLHEASLIAYGSQAQFQIEYRGLLKLVWNSGLVTLVDFDNICENDEILFSKGFNPVFEHKPNLKADRGPAYAYYAYAEIKSAAGGGGKALVVMSKDEITKHAMRFSKTWGKKKRDGSGMFWETDFDAMAIKTVIKQLADKKLPKRTTNEALLFAVAIQKDEKVNYIQENQLGKKIDIQDIESVETEFTPAYRTGRVEEEPEIPEGKSEPKPAGRPAGKQSDGSQLFEK